MKMKNCLLPLSAFILGVALGAFAPDSLAYESTYCDQSDRLAGCVTVTPSSSRPSGSMSTFSRSTRSGSKRRTSSSKKPKPQNSEADGNFDRANVCDSLAQANCVAPGVWNQSTCSCDSGSPSNQPPVTNNPPVPDHTPTGKDSTCVSNITKLLEDCENQQKDANDSCDADKDSGIAQAKEGLSTFALGIDQQMSGAAACTGMGKAVGAANSAVAIFTQGCSTAKSACLAKCLNFKRAVDRDGDRCAGYEPDKNQFNLWRDSASNTLDACNALETKVQQGIAALNNTMSTIQGAQNCAAQLDTTLVYCKQNPTAIGCSAIATDCTNPSIAASSPICICAKNPSDPTCSVAMKSAANGGSMDLASGSAGLSGGSAAS